MKISGIYRITNTITGDFYIGSSKNIKRRWAEHKWQSTWNKHPNNPMYQDMQKYGDDKFVFEIIAEVEEEQLKEKEQEFIEALQPTYNNYNAKGLDVERQKEYLKEYKKTEKYKEYHKEYRNMHKEEIKEYQKEYNNQLCYFNGETLTLNALSMRFRKAGIEHPTQEAKKYLLENKN